MWRQHGFPYHLNLHSFLEFFMFLYLFWSNLSKTSSWMIQHYYFYIIFRLEFVDNVKIECTLRVMNSKDLFSVRWDPLLEPLHAFYIWFAVEYKFDCSFWGFFFSFTAPIHRFKCLYRFSHKFLIMLFDKIIILTCSFIEMECGFDGSHACVWKRDRAKYIENLSDCRMTNGTNAVFSI